jgi:pimeloyl-ACP methyl ester carboxylesterase
MSSQKLILLLLIGLALFLAPAALAAEPTAQTQIGAFEPAACMFKFPFFSFMPPESTGFQCGYVTVPEQHANPNGPAIRLPVAVLRTRSETPEPDPLFMAQGGPGGDAFELFSLTMLNNPIIQDRDLIIFNQRGTLHAEPDLRCTEFYEARPEILTLSPEEALDREKELLDHCRQRFQSEGIDLSAYNSLENAADVEAIRTALGYDQINFYGVSYGTLLALHLMRDHPDHLRSVIIDGVVPTQLNFITQVPQGKERIFSEMFRACANDPVCRAEYPDLEQQFFALVDRLNRQPVTIPLTDPETEVTTEAYVDGDLLIELMFQIFYLSDAYAIFPKVVTDIERGDYSFLQAIWPLFAFDRTLSDGMYFSVVCAEDANFDPGQIPLAGVRPEFAQNAQNELQEYLDVCNSWPVDRLPPSVDAPVVSDIPTLILSGQFDPITPPSFGAAAADFLSNSYNIVSPVSSHGTLGSGGCVDRIVQDFLADPTQPPDSTCLTGLVPDDFVPKNVIRVDLIRELLGELKLEAVLLVSLAGFLLVGVLSAMIVWPLAWLINKILNKKTTLAPSQKRVRRFGTALIILFGLLGLFFGVGLGGVSLYALVANTNLLVLSSLPGWSAPLFIIPWLLMLLALGLLVATFLVWRDRAWPVWGRLYFTFLTLCAVGYVAALAAGGLLTVLV